MNFPTFALAIVLLPWMPLAASAQSMTVTPPAYTTTPPQYTTTPSQYTTTPPQYTTTPPYYVPVQGITPATPTVPTTPTIPMLPTTTPSIPATPTVPYSTTTTPYSTTTMSQNLVTPPTYQRQSTAFESEMVDQVEEEEGVLDVEEEMTSTPNFETLVELYAQCVLQLDEMETEQFVSDFEDVAVQLGLAPGDVGLRVGVKILLCLSLERMLGLSGAGAL